MEVHTSRRNAALAVLLIGVVRHYGYLVADQEHISIASKLLGGAALLAVAPFIWKAYPSRFMVYVLAWWCFESLQTVLCSAAYWVKPWEVLPGQSICSARFGLDLGALGIMAVAGLLWWIVRTDNVRGSGHGQQ